MIRCPEYICECCAAMFLAVCYKAASEMVQNFEYDGDIE